MKLEQRIMIAAKVSRRLSSSDRAVEHPAEGGSINVAGVHTKADDPACELIHHHQYPMDFENEGFAPEEINAP